jgi:hypothetical protein
MSIVDISPHIAALRLAPLGVHNPMEDGMSKSTLTRRTLVAIPAAGALPLPAGADPAAADAELLQLGAQLTRVGRKGSLSGLTTPRNGPHGKRRA